MKFLPREIHPVHTPIIELSEIVRCDVDSAVVNMPPIGENLKFHFKLIAIVVPFRIRPRREDGHFEVNHSMIPIRGNPVDINASIIVFDHYRSMLSDVKIDVIISTLRSIWDMN